MKAFYYLARCGVAALLLASLTSCQDILEQYFPKPTPPSIPTFPPLGLDIPFYALSGGTRLDAYSTTDPATRTASVAITGLVSGERILAMDFRPATGQLYGVSNADRLYVINQSTGVARAIGTGTFFPELRGNLLGFDFNPTTDWIRVVTSTGQFLRLNPETGTVAAIDGAINGAAGAVVTGAAYTNNTAGATTTTLYAINTHNQQLYLVNPPNNGTLVAVGNLNLNVSGDGGFDIDAKTGTALGLYSVNGSPTLFTVDLATGAARRLAQYASGSGYTGIAIPTQPVAYVSAGSSLVIFNPTTPSSATNPAPLVVKPITGLGEDGGVFMLDFRPATGQLYGLATSSNIPRTRLYTINPATGAATLVSPISLPGSNLSVRDMDFNPVTDRIRLFMGRGGNDPSRNLLINPTTGEVVEDTPITPSEDIPFTCAHTNSFAGATSTTLYGLKYEPFNKNDSRIWITQLTGPSENQSVELRELGLEQIIGGSMDIGGTSNTPYALLIKFAGSGPDLYTINLNSPSAPPTTFVAHYPASLGFGFALGLGF
ncbi:hypothetical protein GCM10011375_30640 [Hymenobacter qilianensis]|uniref:Uncharacterized protein n=2 Tax=Hymenobacter qilianensis TaxID=1385715 RepID=A0ACB5PUI4_9BACT|nr:DUF4394 domain-containing protein [Hymenobacter qilianensis]QNP51627.1 DUF4394 domain-containing protein [Hymenobacter qilianensis]GGF73422.1 hypothetical protein GCM10011375_30640 [Hymenobacter qilianensis]